MSKKGTKALASATLMSLVLTTALSAGPVKAAQGSVTRVGEADRYATAAKVATTNWTTSDNVVLVSGEGYADAVSASALAKKLNAPILLTTAGSLSSDTKAALSTLKAKKIYVVGGNASVSASVRAGLKANYSLVELGGANRYETNAAVAQQLVDLGVDPSNAIMVGGEGFSDALSVAPIAAAKGQILLLGMNDANYMQSVINFVKKNKTQVTVVGTKNVINETIYSAVNAVKRVDGGQDRFDTNLKVLDAFKDTVKMDHLYVANASGNGYADALVASAIAGKTAAPLVLVDKEGTTATSNAVNYIKNNATKTTDLNVVGGTGVVSESTVTNINNAVNGTTPIGDGSVDSITATSSTTFQVKFNGAVADTSKYTFDVTRSGAAVALTTTWDSTNTIATLSYSSNLPEDTYTVSVKNGDKEVAKKDVAITAQKIGKIVITSTTLGVTPAATTTGSGIAANTGFATYQVLDQYGNDITTSGIAQGLQWTCGVGQATGDKGLLTIAPFSGVTTPLTQYTTATINGLDQATGVTVSANLTITPSVGTLSDVKLNKLYCSNNDKASFTAGNTSDTFYVDYTAKDLSGNDTKNFNLIKSGLINGVTLTSSNPYVTAKLVQDPADSNKALIQVEPTANSSDVIVDQPVVITVFTSNGKTASINLTLKKSAQVNKFTLMAPAETVAAGDTDIVVPFVAYDQNGAAVTKYDDLKGKVSITASGLRLTETDPGKGLVRNPDGTASIQIAEVPALPTGSTSQSYTVQAVVNNSGSFSTVNIVVQKLGIPDNVTLDNNVVLPNMAVGATQNVDFGNAIYAGGYGGLTLKDQYGRAIDMTNQGEADATAAAGGMDLPKAGTAASPNYYVKATVTGNQNVLKLNQQYAFGNQNIQFTTDPANTTLNNNGGSTTIEYRVFKRVATGATTVGDIDTGIVTSQTYSVIKGTDITGYTLGTIAPIYYAASASATTPTAASGLLGIGSANLDDYAKSTQVYGVMSTGGKVRLDSRDIIAVNVDNTEDFMAYSNLHRTGTTGSAISYGSPKVGAYARKTLDNTKTTASGNVTVTIRGKDDQIYSATAPIKSVKDAPTAKTISFAAKEYGYTSSNGAYKNTGSKLMKVNGNIITMTKTEFDSLLNKPLSAYSLDGSYDNTAGDFYFYAVDQYGTNDAPITSIVGKNLTHPTNAITIDATTNRLTGATVVTGDDIRLTAVTANGLISTVTIQVRDN